MIVVKTEIEDSIISESLDICCLAFINGEESMQDACLIKQDIITEELVYDDSACQINTEIETTFILPEAMTTVRREVGESTRPESLDSCC